MEHCRPEVEAGTRRLTDREKVVSGTVFVASLSFTHCLVVERHHLASDAPKRLWGVIRRIHSGPFGVNPAHLPFIISQKDHLGNEVLYHFFLDFYASKDI